MAQTLTPKRMKTFFPSMPSKTSALVLGIASLGILQSRAELTFYDSFDYTAGELLAPVGNTPGQHNVGYNVDWYDAGLTSPTANQPPGIANTGLSYAGLQASRGNSVLFNATQNGTARIQIAPTAISSGTVYWSGLVRVDSISTLTTSANGMLLGGFNNTAGYQSGNPTAIGAVLRIRQDSVDANSYHIGTGLNAGTGTGNVQFDNATSYAAGETVFVVGSYELVDGSNNDMARMWINPAVSDFGSGTEPAPTLTSAPGGTVPDPFLSLISFDLRNINTVGAPTVLFDELRVGDSWADVTPVPEPGTGVLGAVAAAVLLSLQRYRRR